MLGGPPGKPEHSSLWNLNINNAEKPVRKIPNLKISPKKTLNCLKELQPGWC